MKHCSLKNTLLLSAVGFTVIELMIVTCIIGTLAGIAVPSFINYKSRAKNIRCIAELKIIEKELYSFQMERDRWPDSLAEIGLDTMTDPWGNPYEYLPIDVAPTLNKKGKVIKNTGIGNFRKDHFMVPVNTDFDLYSKGPDGDSVAPFTAKASRDDIVRANNGQYVGLVSGY